MSEQLLQGWPFSSGRPGEFVIAWEYVLANQDADIMARGINTNGPAFADKKLNTDTQGAQIRPEVAMSSAGTFVVVWQDDKSGDYEIFARGFNGDGTERFSDTLVNTNSVGQQRLPRVGVGPNGHFVVVWQDRRAAPRTVYARGFDADGLEVLAEMPIDGPGPKSRPDVAVAGDGSFVVTWQAGKDKVYAAAYYANGVLRFAPVQVSTTTTGRQIRPRVAVAPDARFAVTWESISADGTTVAVKARCFAANGTALTGEFTVNSLVGLSKRPAIAINQNGRFAITWQYRASGQAVNTREIYVRGFEMDGLPYFAEKVVSDPAFSKNHRTPAIAMGLNGNFIVAYAGRMLDQNVGDRADIHCRAYNADGTASSDQLRVNNDVQDQQLRPTIAITDFSTSSSSSSSSSSTSSSSSSTSSSSSSSSTSSSSSSSTSSSSSSSTSSSSSSSTSSSSSSSTSSSSSSSSTSSSSSSSSTSSSSSSSSTSSSSSSSSTSSSSSSSSTSSSSSSSSTSSSSSSSSTSSSSSSSSSSSGMNCIWQFTGCWNCDTSSGSILGCELVECDDPANYTLDTWQLVESTGYPVICKYVMYRSGDTCSQATTCTTPPAAPAVPDGTDCIAEPWYKVKLKIWNPGSTCASLNPDQPDSTQDTCWSLADIYSYGGWETCYWDPANGCLIIEKLAGPFVTEGECQA